MRPSHYVGFGGAFDMNGSTLYKIVLNTILYSAEDVLPMKLFHSRTIFLLFSFSILSSTTTFAQKLDTTGAIDAPVSGAVDTATSLVTSLSEHPAPQGVRRTITNHQSDLPTLRDYGWKLTGDTNWGPDIDLMTANWNTFTGYTPIILPAGTHWPNNRYVPVEDITKSTEDQYPIVHAFNRTNQRPGYNLPAFGFGVPYYGDGVASYTHDDSEFTWARVDSDDMSAMTHVGLGEFDVVIDTPNEGCGSGGAECQQTLASTMITTQKAKGTIGNFITKMYSGGISYWGGMDVNKWSHTVHTGTNWVWDNIQELYDGNPYYINPNESNVAAASYMNEEDMYGAGPEKPDTYYDPTAGNRQMFWLTTNHNINYNSSSLNRWSATTPTFRYRMIFVKNSAGHEYMFYGNNTNYVVNGPSYGITGSISGNTLTVSATSTTITSRMRVWSFDINKEVEITKQLTGTTGGIGTYTVVDHTATGNTSLSIPSSTLTVGNSPVWSTTGTTEPKWTFNHGDTITDGTVKWTCIGPWTYELGSIIRVGGSNDPKNGYYEKIGSILSEETDWIYNALIDFSKAQFDPDIPYAVDMRVKKDTWFDFTADGTKDGQNNHLLGYESGSALLTYKVGGTDVTGISDTGIVSLNGVKPVTTSNTLSSIKAGSYTEGTRIWCHDCRATGQAKGAGTGRWIYKDSAGTWRTDDGLEASN